MHRIMPKLLHLLSGSYENAVSMYEVPLTIGEPGTDPFSTQDLWVGSRSWYEGPEGTNVEQGNCLPTNSLIMQDSKPYEMGFSQRIQDIQPRIYSTGNTKPVYSTRMDSTTDAGARACSIVLVRDAKRRKKALICKGSQRLHEFTMERGTHSEGHGERDEKEEEEWTGRPPQIRHEVEDQVD